MGSAKAIPTRPPQRASGSTTITIRRVAVCSADDFASSNQTVENGRTHCTGVISHSTAEEDRAPVQRPHRAREVRLIGPDGSQLGIKTVPEALRLARELDLDLVEVAPMANPPVCRIMDYGKFRYEESQKAKEARRKKSIHVSIKEVKFRPKIGKGDFDTKVRHMQEFLAEGHKVKVTLQFRGREMAHPELGSQDPRRRDRASRRRRARSRTRPGWKVAT